MKFPNSLRTDVNNVRGHVTRFFTDNYLFKLIHHLAKEEKLLPTNSRKKLLMREVDLAHFTAAALRRSLAMGKAMMASVRQCVHWSHADMHSIQRVQNVALQNLTYVSGQRIGSFLESLHNEGVNECLRWGVRQPDICIVIWLMLCAAH